ncbi:Os05g0423301 [Oryza sativa Japonica Group]|uniref:Os05g0423301 protein n=1 Tax=Oryza sativa subsp. japonica TaxID=39947 RepID=A0A0P0WMI2_ORYSJ|nr:Os05g0423301 [Oryza sativa Japonica Group]
MASTNSCCNHMIFKLILGAIEKLKKKRNSSFATILSPCFCFATGDCPAHRLHLPVLACKRNRKATYSLQTIGSAPRCRRWGRRAGAAGVVALGGGGGGASSQPRRRQLSAVGAVLGGGELAHPGGGGDLQRRLVVR